MRGVIDRGAVVNAKDSCGADALMCAAFYDRIPAVTLLLDHGADLNARVNDGWNALMFAARNNKLDCAVFLLNRGVDLLAVNSKGKTALDLYGSDLNIKPPLSDEVKEQRREVLRGAYAKIQVVRLKQEVAVLRRPARVNASMLFSDKFSDVVLEAVGGERISAHKVVLAASSECMDKLLSGQWAESASGVVRMEESVTAVKALLRFMYTGEVDVAALGSDLGGVLELAKKHEQEELVTACEQHALKALTRKGVVATFVLGSVHNMAALKAACVNFIKADIETYSAVTASKKYRNLDKKNPAAWLELRVALGLPEEESDDDDDVEGPAQKIPRVGK
jgi:hypothetical protein